MGIVCAETGARDKPVRGRAPLTFDFENGEQLVALLCPLPLELVRLRVLTPLSVSRSLSRNPPDNSVEVFRSPAASRRKGPRYFSDVDEAGAHRTTKIPQKKT